MQCRTDRPGHCNYSSHHPMNYYAFRPWNPLSLQLTLSGKLQRLACNIQDTPPEIYLLTLRTIVSFTEWISTQRSIISFSRITYSIIKLNEQICTSTQKEKWTFGPLQKRALVTWTAQNLPITSGKNLHVSCNVRYGTNKTFHRKYVPPMRRLISCTTFIWCGRYAGTIVPWFSCRATPF